MTYKMKERGIYKEKFELISKSDFRTSSSHPFTPRLIHSLTEETNASAFSNPSLFLTFE